MNKKVSALLLIVAAIGLILVVKQYYFKPPAPIEHGQALPNLSAQEILTLTDNSEKPLLIHFYARNPNCPNCDVTFIEKELNKVAQLEQAFGDQIQVVRINVFDYAQEDINWLAQRFQVSQTPTTVVISKQQIVGKEEGPITQSKTEILLKEVTKL